MSFKNFEVIKELGKGSFASVSLVKRKEDKKLYALKRVKITQMSDKEKENALNEVRLLASVQHVNIIGFKESFFDEESKTLNIVMEFADDGDLSGKIEKSIKNNTVIPENEIWSILIQIIQGIKAMHDNNIMHRDLKSANIFIMKNGLIKLGDFNVSKVIKNNKNHTQTGTPYYCAPEIWCDKPYDYKCDVWSVGCVVYELCTQKPPFGGNDITQLYKNIMKGVYTPLPKCYSKELGAIISQLLELKPGKRPTCDEILSHSSILKRMDYTKNISVTEKALLLSTIKIPKDLKDINKQLPKRAYDHEFKKLEADLRIPQKDGKTPKHLADVKDSKEKENSNDDRFKRILACKSIESNNLIKKDEANMPVKIQSPIQEVPKKKDSSSSCNKQKTPQTKVKSVQIHAKKSPYVNVLKSKPIASPNLPSKHYVYNSKQNPARNMIKPYSPLTNDKVGSKPSSSRNSKASENSHRSGSTRPDSPACKKLPPKLFENNKNDIVYKPMTPMSKKPNSALSKNNPIYSSKEIKQVQIVQVSEYKPIVKSGKSSSSNNQPIVRLDGIKASGNAGVGPAAISQKLQKNQNNKFLKNAGNVGNAAVSAGPCAQRLNVAAPSKPFVKI